MTVRTAEGATDARPPGSSEACENYPTCVLVIGFVQALSQAERRISRLQVYRHLLVKWFRQRRTFNVGT
ncbi:MAG: hypothetical protein EOO60_09495 [Hymenobacter sp.]|nr:MAG: hypothetical protein EOO60_09495 [Hymenobacter sp.]